MPSNCNEILSLSKIVYYLTKHVCLIWRHFYAEVVAIFSTRQCAIILSCAGNCQLAARASQNFKSNTAGLKLCWRENEAHRHA